MKKNAILQFILDSWRTLFFGLNWCPIAEYVPEGIVFSIPILKRRPICPQHNKETNINLLIAIIYIKPLIFLLSGLMLPAYETIVWLISLERARKQEHGHIHHREAHPEEYYPCSHNPSLHVESFWNRSGEWHQETIHKIVLSCLEQHSGSVPKCRGCHQRLSERGLAELSRRSGLTVMTTTLCRGITTIRSAVSSSAPLDNILIILFCQICIIHWKEGQSHGPGRKGSEPGFSSWWESVF